MEPLERLYQEVVDREPDRAAPVGVAAEQAQVRLRRFVVDAVVGPVDRQDERVVAVVPAEGADTVICEELLRIEHPREQRSEPIAVDEGEEAPLPDARLVPGG